MSAPHRKASVSGGIPPPPSLPSQSSSQFVMTPLPMTQIWVAGFVQITEGMNTNILFPFMAFMTEDFGYTGHRLGIYAGMMAATFSGAQFCSSILWGIISDKYGRRAAIVYGVIGAAVGMAIFGSATTYTQAIIGRAISGFLSGNLGIIKSFLTEITDKTNRSKAFSLWSLASTFGNILGPLMGGYLCKPAEKYPKYFHQDSIFAKHPYFLPCFVAVVLDVLCGIYCIFFMIETRNNNDKDNNNNDGSVNKNIRDNVDASVGLLTPRSSFATLATLANDDDEDDDDYGEGNDIEGSKKQSQITSAIGTIYSNSNDGEIGIEMSEIEESRSLFQKGVNYSKSSGEEGKSYSSKDFQNISISSDNDVVLSPIVHKYSPVGNSSSPFGNDSQHGGGDADELFVVDDGDFDSESKVESKEGDLDNGKFITVTNESKLSEDLDSISKHRASVLSSPKVIWSTSSYGAIAMAFVLMDETLPLLLKQDVEEGGFSFTSSDIGTALSISTVPLFIFSFFFLSQFCEGSKLVLFEKYLFRVIPVVLMYPTLAYLNRYFISTLENKSVAFYLKWGALLSAYTLRNIFATLAFSGIIMLINNSAPEADLGIVNGLGQSMASAARCIGPACGGALWSLSVRFKFFYLNFLVVVVIILGAIHCGRLLPKDIDYTVKGDASAAGGGE